MKHQDGLELYVVGTRKQRKVSKQVADFLQQHRLFSQPNKVTGPIIVQWRDNEIVKAKFGIVDLEMFISKDERHRHLCSALDELQRADMREYATTNHEKAVVRSQNCGW